MTRFDGQAVRQFEEGIVLKLRLGYNFYRDCGSTGQGPIFTEAGVYRTGSNFYRAVSLQDRVQFLQKLWVYRTRFNFYRGCGSIGQGLRSRGSSCCDKLVNLINVTAVADVLIVSK